MNKFYAIPAFALLALSACVTTKVETQPVSSALAPMEQPGKNVGAVWKYQQGGEIKDSILVAMTETEDTWRESDGCEYTQLGNGFAPSSRWTGCGTSDGTQQVTVDGSIWPLQVSAEVSYDFSGRNKFGDSWKGTRNCVVKEEVRVTVPAGTFDTFHVVCNDPWRSRDWYVSPELGTTVLYVQRHKQRNEVQRSELVSWDPGVAS